MNERAINSAAGVILAALQQNRTSAGIALALDAAGLLNSPERAADLVRLRARVAELEVQLAATEAPDDEDPIAYTLTPKAAVDSDVSPQVRKLRAILAGQREQAGGAPC